MSARMRLRRADGEVYLDRWGIQFGRSSVPGSRTSSGRFGGIFLHRMDAPDPGLDLHDHPWTFVSLILWGGYEEERAEVRDAVGLAHATGERGRPSRFDMLLSRHERRRLGSIRRLRLDECHRITRLTGRGSTWTIVVHGPKRRGWGFYTPEGWMDWRRYERTIRAHRRDLWAEISSNDPSRVAQR